MVELLDAGIRICEFVSIRMADTDPGHGLVEVIGKGQKERIVLLHKVTRKELIRYTKRFRSSVCAEESPYLFSMSDGDHISVNSVQ